MTQTDLTVKSFSLRGIELGAAPEREGMYGIPVVLSDDGCIERKGFIYVSPDSTLSIGSFSCTIEQLYALINGLEPVQITTNL